MSFIEDNKLFNELYKKIEGKGLKVVLPEGNDDRVIDAVEISPGIHKVLLGEKAVMTDKCMAKFGEIPECVTLIDESEFEQRTDLFDLFMEKRKGKVTEEEARKLFVQRNYFATLLLENGDVDALVGGCLYSTADILKPAFQIIKTAPGNNIVSSCFFMQKEEETLVFADCAVNVDPTSEQLQDITTQTISTCRNMGVNPKVAMLSYSTKGSGFGEYVDKVRDAYEGLIKNHPELEYIVDGELQFDAAYVNRVAKTKSPDSPVAGQANVFIFPHIMAGNIAYKMTQYLGGYEAVGPMLQGLNKPVNDLSRGTDAVTIAKMMYVSLRDY